MVEKIIKSTHYKLILLLAQLEPSEWRALKKFILMYTRESSDNFELFTLLRKDIDHLNTNEEVKQLHQEHFPQMTSKTYSNMMSRLTVWVEDWMVYEDMRKSDDKDIRLIRLYNSRGLYKESNAVARKAIKTAKNKPGLSLMASKNLAQIYYYQYFSNNPIKYQQINLIDKMISTHLQNFRNTAMVLKNQSIFSKVATPVDKNLYEDSLQIIINLLPKSSVTELLTSIQTLLTKDNYQSLLFIKGKLENTEILPNSDLHVITTMYALNSTQSLWAKNKFKDSQVVLDILNYAINSRVILSNEKIAPFLWQYMLTIIGTTKDYNKSKEFIDKWHKQVYTKDYTILKSLSMAEICFHQEKFEEIREHIYKMEIIEPEQKERANSLIVISLYHNRNKNYKLFVDFANNLLRQLKRAKRKLPIPTYEGYVNLTLTLLSLAKSSFSESQSMIDDSKHIMYRTWLRKEIKKAGTKR